MLRDTRAAFSLPVEHARHDHRPHLRQVTGARCTEVAARQSWTEYSSRPTTDSRHQGWAIKRFFRFKRNAYHLWTAIIRHRLNDITHPQVMRFNQGSKIANIFKVHRKHPQCFGTLAQPPHFLSNTPLMTQRIFTGSARVEWLWINDFCPNEYHIWHGWPSTCWHVENKSPKYEVPIFTAQTCDHWRKSKGCASVPKNGLPNWCD